MPKSSADSDSTQLEWTKGHPLSQYKLLLRTLTDLQKSSARTASEEGDHGRVQVLWSNCCSEDPLLSSIASNLLVESVKAGILQYSYVLNGFLFRIKNSKNNRHALNGFMQLLTLPGCMELMGSHGPTSHPLVIVLRNSPSLANPILGHIKDLLQTSLTCLRLLEPFLLHVLCDPEPVMELQVLKTHLVMPMLHSASSNPRLKMLLLHSLKWQQTMQGSLESTMDFLQLMSQWCVEEDEEWNERLYPLQVILSLRALKSGFDPSQFLQTMLRNLQFLRPGKEVEVTYLLMAEFLHCAPPSLTARILLICRTMLMQGKISGAVACSIIPSLLQLISTTSPFLSEEQILARDLIAHLGMLQTCPIPTHVLLLDDWMLFDPLYTQAVHALHLLCHYKSALSLKDALGNPFIPLLLGGWVHFEGALAGEDAWKVLVEAGKLDPKRALDLLPLLLYHLSKEGQPQLRLCILLLLPSLAVHKACVGPVLQVIQGLWRTKSLQPIAFKLFHSLWKVENRCYPYLEKALLEEASGSSLTAGISEFLLSKVIVIRDICLTEPSRHGSVLVAPLSQIINLSNSVEMAGVAGLALDAVSHLCRQEVIDIRTTWKILASKLTKDSRPLVTTKLIEMLSLVPELHVPSPEFQRFTENILAVLWRYTGSPDPSITEAAFRALSHFKLGMFNLSSIPEVGKENLEAHKAAAATPFEAAKQPEDLLDFVPGECFVKLLRHPQEESGIQAYGTLLSSLVKEEISALPQSVYYVAMQKAHERCSPTNPSGEPLSYSFLTDRSILKAIINHLRRQCNMSAMEPGVEVCLEALSQDFPRPLPPLSWYDLLVPLTQHSVSLLKASLIIAIRQSLASASAKLFLHAWISPSPPQALTIDVSEVLFSLLGKIGSVIPPADFQPFVMSQLQGMRDMTILLQHVPAALRDTSLHENNRTILGNAIESIAEKIDLGNQTQLNAFLESATELPAVHFERLTSPTSWWEVTGPKLLMASRICAHATLKSATSNSDTNPLIWINGIIDATANHPLQQKEVWKILKAGMEGVKKAREQADWIRELMGRISTLSTAFQSLEQEPFIVIQVIGFYMEILANALLTFAHWPIPESVEDRFLLCPAALAILLESHAWRDSISAITGWVLQMMDSCHVSQAQKTGLMRMLLVSRHGSHFCKTSVWNKAVPLLSE